MNGNEPAYPAGNVPVKWAGLTKREWLAGMILSGTAGEAINTCAEVEANGAPMKNEEVCQGIVGMASFLADALLAELDKEPKRD